MLAKLQEQLPRGEGWLYEPKWDGFRAIVFRDGTFREGYGKTVKSGRYLRAGAERSQFAGSSA